MVRERPVEADIVGCFVGEEASLARKVVEQDRRNGGSGKAIHDHSTRAPGRATSASTFILWRQAAVDGPGAAANTRGMIGELAVSTVMVCLTVAIHAAGLFMLGRLLGLEEREEAAEHIHPMSPRGVAATLTAIMGIFVLRGVEIWLYAFLYQGLGAVGTLRDAVYFRPSRTARSATATPRCWSGGGWFPRSRGSTASS